MGGMMLDGMITNRTHADVTAKNGNGTYNYTDLNRVENAVAALQAALNGVGYNLSLVVKTDWAGGDAPDVPTQSDMERYRSNVSAIRAALAVFSTTPDVPPSMNKLTFTGANAIEQILLDVETIIDRMTHTINLGWALGIAHTGIYGGIA